MAENAKQKERRVDLERTLVREVAKGLRRYRLSQNQIPLAALEEKLHSTEREYRFLVQAEIWHFGLNSREWKELCKTARQSLTRPQIAAMIGVSQATEDASIAELNALISKRFVEFDAIEMDGTQLIFPLVYAVEGENLADYQRQVSEARITIIKNRTS